jgi:hypothetical protein
MNYILFEKKSENERPVWDKEHVTTFCEEQKIDYLGIVEELQFFVVKVSEHDDEQKFRLLEVTDTITFLMKDDPTLDEFMERNLPKTVRFEEQKNEEVA